MRLSTRDRNLLKILVALPASVSVIGLSASRTLRMLGLERNGSLASVGFLAVAYLVARCVMGWRRFRSTKMEEAQWSKKCALVTGCTAGLGLAFAEGFRRRGCGLILVSRSQLKLEGLKEKLLVSYPENREPIDLVCFDFTTSDRSFYEHELPEISQKVDVAVNNVGVGTEDPLSIDEISTMEIDKMIAINCAATTHMCRCLLPVLAARRGVLVNVSSGSAIQPTPYLAVYAATKAFVAHLSKSLDREWRMHGARVLCIAPYYISDTGLFKSKKQTVNAPPPRVIVDGTLATLTDPWRAHLELTHTNAAHAFIAFLFATIAEDPILKHLAKPIARAANVNASMLEVMTKARLRHLSKPHTVQSR